MTAQVIPARTMELAQTKWTDLTAAAHQALMEHNVKQVTVTDNITNFKVPVNNKTAMFTNDWEPIKRYLLAIDNHWKRAKNGKFVFDRYGHKETKR